MAIDSGQRRDLLFVQSTTEVGGAIDRMASELLAHLDRLAGGC